MPRHLYDWKAIQLYHDAGHGFVACRNRFGFSHTAWVKAIRAGTLRSTERGFPDRRRRYDWAAVQAYYDEGHSYYECMERFGFTPGSWYKARLRHEITPRPLARPLHLLLRTSKSRRVVKHRLLQAGILKNECSICGISEWMGRPLSIHVDHINGIKDDHRIENLRMLCPNCHSQTDTYGAKNRLRKRLQDHGQVV